MGDNENAIIDTRTMLKGSSKMLPAAKILKKSKVSLSDLYQNDKGGEATKSM